MDTDQKTSVWYVYCIKRNDSNEEVPTGRGNRSQYVGMTNRLHTRIQRHNAGYNRATRGAQWTLIAACYVSTRRQAATLEAWLKTGNSVEKRTAFKSLCRTDGRLVRVCPTELLSRALTWRAKREFAQNIETFVSDSLRGKAKEIEPNG